MPTSKRIIISISEMLLSEVDSFTVLEKRNRSEIVRDAIKFYLEERKKELMIEQMKKGYLEMAPINLTIASESSVLEEEILVWRDYKLLE
ncbi:MAG: CopG family transcriptional regulator [Firmicutes bacterium HGW-Firmicutes-15]|nr:MAG: CopG family transcriptional regulator [Firmicutes bacterium HGW-Firmicutes-15]